MVRYGPVGVGHVGGYGHPGFGYGYPSYGYAYASPYPVAPYPGYGGWGYGPYPGYNDFSGAVLAGTALAVGLGALASQ